MALARDADMANFGLVKSFAEAKTEHEFRRQTVREAREALGVDLDPMFWMVFQVRRAGMG